MTFAHLILPEQKPLLEQERHLEDDLSWGGHALLN